jgi:hypothetical protein
MKVAQSGDNVKVRLRGVSDEDVSSGFVLCDVRQPVHVVTRFEAELVIIDSKNIICAGYSAVMHVHTLAEEITLAVRSPCLHWPELLIIKRTGVVALLRQGDRAKVAQAATVCQKECAMTCQPHRMAS